MNDYRYKFEISRTAYNRVYLRCFGPTPKSSLTVGLQILSERYP